MTAFSASDFTSARFARPGDPRPGPLALPVDDAFAVTEGATLTGNVFADNGSGPDVDGAPAVSTVNGDGASVGVQITLTSGALLTLNADGTFSYDPNGAFDALPASGSGASITSAVDSFTYTLVGGGSATVTITVNGQDTIGDELVGTSGADTLDGGVGADLMAGGAGNDIYHVDDEDDLVFELAGEGSDWVYSSVDYELMQGSYVQRLILTGTADLYASGNSFRNTLIGNSGDNILDGGGSNDIMRGGDGDDAYFVDHAGDVVTELEDEGLDVIYSEISYTLLDTSFVEVLVLDCGADIDATGNNQVNYLVGNCGENVLNGMGGADAMEGGGGDDTYYVDDVDDWVIEYEGEGNDQVFSTVSYALLYGSYVQGLTLLGTGDLDAYGNEFRNTLTGNSGVNTLDGDDGADILNGMGGADVMIGGLGSDTYYVDNVGDVIEEYIGEGNDSVFASVSYTLQPGVFVQTLTLTGSSDNRLATGNSYRNTLIGGSGDDGLIGGGGDDVLDGKAGVDDMHGGTGDDTYYVDHPDDIVGEELGEGVDRVFSSVSYGCTTAVENLTLTGTADIDGTGNQGANIITGNDGVNTLRSHGGADILDGGAGADVMIGGTGDDTYYVDNAGDVIIELKGEGNDTVFTTVTYVLAAGVFVQTLTLEAGADDFNLTGNAYRNTLNGNAGDNILDGGGSNDILQGGDGDDTYYVDHVDDVVVELAGEGDDTVYASVSYALDPNVYVQTVILSGTTVDCDLTGNRFANTLIGDHETNILRGMAGDDVLDGGGGADILMGGAGDDTFIVNHSGDVVVELEGEGADTILSSVSYAMATGSYVQILTLTGVANLNASGNGLGNALNGNSGANRLEGKGNGDMLTGGGGADTFVYSSTAHSTSSAMDRITDLSSDDFIDLSAIDANVNLAGTQHFVLVDSFTNTAGQVVISYDVGMGLTVLRADTNGDMVSDMVVLIDGNHEDFTNFIFGGG